jgi:hypothetical protein
VISHAANAVPHRAAVAIKAAVKVFNMASILPWIFHSL